MRQSCRVDAAWRRLLERVGPRPGVPTTDHPDLHLLVDGRRVDAASRSGVLHIFRLAAGPTTVRIVSRTGVPQELGVARDPRCLGVGLRQITVTQGQRVRAIEAENERLIVGFHAFEADNGLRWTDGDATMPAHLHAGFAGPVEVALHIGGTTRYVADGRDARRLSELAEPGAGGAFLRKRPHRPRAAKTASNGRRLPQTDHAHEPA
jgi:hypothetical protein